MKEITGLQKAKQVLGEFRFSDFPIIREIRFFENNQNQSVELIVESENRKPNYRIKLVFSGVAQLTIKNFGGGETRINGLDILHVAEKQWEGISWEVTDFEHGDLQFYAQAAQLVSVTPI